MLSRCVAAEPEITPTHCLLQGVDAPRDINADHLIWLGQGTNHPRVPYAPYLSRDICEDGRDLYRQLSDGLRPVLSWIQTEVRKLPSVMA
jgi:hypothetical protein